MIKEFSIIFILLAIFFYLSQDPFKNKNKNQQKSKWDFWLKITGGIIISLIFILIGTKYSSSINWFMSKIPFLNKYFDTEMPVQSGGAGEIVSDEVFDFDMDDNISIISE